MKAKDKRVTYVDQVSGLLIMYMILYHCFQWSELNYVNRTLWMLPLSFFMFWFFYKSGMFYRDKTCKEILFGGGKKLMVPYVVYSMIGYVLKCVQLLVGGDHDWVHYVLSPVKQIVLEGAVSGNMALWFLPSLLAVQALYALLRRRLGDVWIVIAGLLVAYMLYAVGFHKPLYVANIPLGLSVYGFGHLMRNVQYEKSVFALTGIAYLAIMLMMRSTIDFRTNMLHGGNYPVAVLFALSGCVVINNLFKRMPFRISVLEWIGKRSMNFYVMHWLVLLSCSIIFPYTGWAMLAVMVVACVVVLPMADRILLMVSKGSVVK